METLWSEVHHISRASREDAPVVAGRVLPFKNLYKMLRSAAPWPSTGWCRALHSTWERGQQKVGKGLPLIPVQYTSLTPSGAPEGHVPSGQLAVPTRAHHLRDGI